MGTLLELSVVARDPEAGRAAMGGGFALAAELDDLFSRYVPGSDPNRLARESGGDWLAVDPRTVEILARAVDYARLTDGCFDVTVGPLVSLWIDAAESDRIPDEAAIARARRLVGATELELAPPDRARLPRRGMSVDLGGIAKGYALDRMVPRLRGAGIDDALLSFGRSSVWAVGRPPDAPGWRLLVEGPDGRYTGVVTLRDLAFSVSSTLGRSSEIAGERFGHVIDPRTGWPVRSGMQAAVVARDASLAEALSTALVVLGRDAGLVLVGQLDGVEAFLIEESGERVMSDGWIDATAYQDLAQDLAGGPSLLQ